jgi:D-glycero-D-manno-heptose 1,7-bisphosphate phosphatase
MTQKAVFLDRDGTLIVERHYLSDPAQLELIPDVPESLLRLSEAGFLLIVVTNQSGIAQGKFSESRYVEVQEALDVLLGQYGVRLTHTYFCPHHPQVSSCTCRKPLPGLLNEAILTYQLDPKRCFMIGDRDRDVQAGVAAGIPSLLVRTGYGAGETGDGAVCICDTFKKATDWILSGESFDPIQPDGSGRQ